MVAQEPAREPIRQRNEKPINVPPGFWKQQLATKYLEIAAKGDVEALRQLLAQHPEFLHKRGPHNRTLLWEAARRGKLSAVQWLVEQGAPLDATGSYNHESFVQLTPYCAAIYYRRAEVAGYLRSKDAQADIFRAAFLGDLDRVDRQLAAQPDLVQAEDPHDFIYYVPPLSFAVVGEHIEMLEFLLQRGAVLAPYSAQLLTLAARNSRKDILDLLISRGADLHTVGPDIFVATPDLEILKFLLKNGASATKPHANGFTPLVYLARGDKGEHPEKIQLLLEYGAQVNVVGPQGRTALHYAAAAGFLSVITLLLDHQADFTLKDEAGHTPLSLARSAGKISAAALLEERGK